MSRVPEGNIKPTPPRPVFSPRVLDFSERDVGWAPLGAIPNRHPPVEAPLGAYRGGSPLRSAAPILWDLMWIAKACSPLASLIVSPRILDPFHTPLTLFAVHTEENIFLRIIDSPRRAFLPLALSALKFAEGSIRDPPIQISDPHA